MPGDLQHARRTLTVARNGQWLDVILWDYNPRNAATIDGASGFGANGSYAQSARPTDMSSPGAPFSRVHMSSPHTGVGRRSGRRRVAPSARTSGAAQWLSLYSPATGRSPSPSSLGYGVMGYGAGSSWSGGRTHSRRSSRRNQRPHTSHGVRTPTYYAPPSHGAQDRHTALFHADALSRMPKSLQAVSPWGQGPGRAVRPQSAAAKSTRQRGHRRGASATSFDHLGMHNPLGKAASARHLPGKRGLYSRTRRGPPTGEQLAVLATSPPRTAAASSPPNPEAWVQAADSAAAKAYPKGLPSAGVRRSPVTAPTPGSVLSLDVAAHPVPVVPVSPLDTAVDKEWEDRVAQAAYSPAVAPQPAMWTAASAKPGLAQRGGWGRERSGPSTVEQKKTRSATVVNPMTLAMHDLPLSLAPHAQAMKPHAVAVSRAGVRRQRR